MKRPFIYRLHGLKYHTSQSLKCIPDLGVFVKRSTVENLAFFATPKLNYNTKDFGLFQYILAYSNIL